MKGRVCNKKARWNLCFSDFDQPPEYENGKGTIINFTHLPILSLLRSRLPDIFGVKSQNMLAEGNYYYDLNKCYIGYHGDVERRRVIGVRLGSTMPIHFKWYQNYEPQDTKTTIYLKHGDMYCMSEKAVGTDWKKKLIWTLRHSAGWDSKDFKAFNKFKIFFFNEIQIHWKINDLNCHLIVASLKFDDLNCHLIVASLKFDFYIYSI